MNWQALMVLRDWTSRQWGTAAVSAIGFGLLVAIPTDLIDTPVFGREIPPTWWSWPALVMTAVLTGLLVATYVNPVQPDDRRTRRGGWVGGTLTFFAVGCPVCNKIVLILLGTSGALTWFEPLQPVLQLAAVVLLGWALRARLRGAVACPAPSTPNSTQTPAESTDRGISHV